ncbi:MAG: hypothetical protein WDO56_05500 [Gammaproteobacteria bacterium]
MTTFQMDPEVKAFVKAHRRLCKHYANTRLKFTLDGKLVGDLAEVIASKLFRLTLCRERTPGVDGHAPDGRSVQVKSTGSSFKGPAFTPGEGRADHLIFLRLDFDRATGAVVYNGPEAPIRRLLPAGFTGTKRANLSKVVAADKEVAMKDRLRRR